jgi:hypothetical protein
MTAREHAEELRQEAIKTLLAERDEIDVQLKQLGYAQEIKTASSGKRRGRPPKDGTPVPEIKQTPDDSDTTQSGSPSTHPQSNT